MYYIEVETIENDQKTTYSDKLTNIQEVMDYIDFFRKQDDLQILDLRINKRG